ncbi:MAG: hypothetical protein KJ052_11450, partial [Candidatus Hydrogenedentes bacterium]|nr:hypothetical protein [Candidatus Hydrogenedentota bacterium]
MTLERALVAQGRPHMGARLAAALVQREAAKGCSPQLAPCPVSIEPPYCSFAEGAKTIFQKESNW